MVLCLQLGTRDEHFSLLLEAAPARYVIPLSHLTGSSAITATCAVPAVGGRSSGTSWAETRARRGLSAVHQQCRLSLLL